MKEPENNFRYYDQGWNAFIKGEPFNPRASSDWRDGWTDCMEAPEKDRVPC
ncbi:hypothetical protein KTE58_23655 [Burkholderia multivorans]|uniref:hypothetical protein n=1 Tax=Burkholderia multivorans TaxID=87883 RepID=UPI001C25E83F|nr:hypothetical protein [Burkholderia multivorans]MBU9539385.1 hypothetical protein [Burkholderia multivorans]